MPALARPSSTRCCRCSASTLEDIAISELCVAAGISQATFFNYFPSKPALLTCFIRVWSLQVSALAVDIIAEHDTPPPPIELPDRYLLLPDVEDVMALWLFEAWRRRIGDGWGVLLFVALTVALEWIAGRYGAQGSWGSVAYTQIDNLALLQSASLVGLSGIAALMSAAAALAAVAIDGQRERAWRAGVVVTAGLLLAAQLWGAWRLTRPLDGPHITVAGVVSDIGPDASAAELAAATDALFRPL